MQLIRSLHYVNNVDAGNRFAKIELDTDIETELEITLNGTDDTGDYVQHHFVAIDNYDNSEAVDIVIDDLTASVPSFTKVIWEVNPLTQLLRVSASVGTVTIWVSEKKLPIGEGINQHGVDTVGSNVLRVNSKTALAGVANPKQDMAAYITQKYIKGLFTFDASNHNADVLADVGQGVFIAPVSDLTGASGCWIREYSLGLNTWWFGAVPDLLLNGNMATPNPNPTDSGIAAVRAIALSKYLYDNASIGGYYKGGHEVYTPPGGYWANTSTFNLLHIFKFRGFGDGKDAPSSGGVTHWKWAPNVVGIIFQGPNTSGVFAVDALTHDGCGGTLLEDMFLEGAWSLGVNEDGDFDAVVIRNPARIKNVTAKNWQGRGFRAWAGVTSGGPNVGGNASGSFLESCKSEGCLGGFDIDGADANLVQDNNCNWYQNRQFGRRSANGAGAGVAHNSHAASNGMISNLGKYTQTSLAGERYGLFPTGNPLNSPSGTTADTADWAHIEAGGVVANLIPAYVATPGLFRYGGDYVSIGSDSTTYNTVYSEGGTMSFFNFGALVINPVISNQYFRGGVALIPASNGLNIRQSGNSTLNIEGGGGEAALFASDLVGNVTGYLDFVKNSGAILLGYGYVNIRIGTYSVNTTPVSFDDTGINLAAGRTYKINGVQVLNGQMVHMANLGAPPTAADFNTLLGELQTVKLMA